MVVIKAMKIEIVVNEWVYINFVVIFILLERINNFMNIVEAVSWLSFSV